MNRRHLIAGLAACALPLYPSGPALAAGSASRSFRILRDGSEIGSHSLAARAGPDGFEIEIEIDIVVRVLGIAAYRYRLRNRERWAGGRLVELDAATNDDGTENFARIRREADALAVEGSGHTGRVPLDAATTSYFVPEFLDRRIWISTQSGTPLAVKVAPAGPGRWAVSGELDTTLFYDGRGEWMGSEFDAGGETASYELVAQSGRIVPLWRGS
ncbi:hypothetical protein LNKW23_29770 [Paralimibaculum aggregatum]|uniref:DUF3108 domain-containing protein n=1 Tax=Paralimibaculum aggregatum TaxID=3036245 RepID=A0ABQ6LKI8_9RHOB|nr:DUF6134 family protein [Limibaculum sp. NKW23]GMG83763.1 hypothetical protein LNKW23_29770 [Limibaculum sp. NKW23]